MDWRVRYVYLIKLKEKYRSLSSTQLFFPFGAAFNTSNSKYKYFSDATDFLYSLTRR